MSCFERRERRRSSRVAILCATALWSIGVIAQETNRGRGIADYIKLGLADKDASIATPNKPGAIPWTTTGCATFSTPGPLTTGRYSCSDLPCVAYCLPDDKTCLSSASAVIATCSPQWTDYSSSSMSYGSQITNTKQWVEDTLSLTYTHTLTEYSATSTASTVYSSAGQLPLTPVYLLGSAETTITTTTSSYQTITAPPTYSVSPPCCRITEVVKQDCLQCSINGGTVQLLYWPPNTQNGTAGVTSAPSVLTTLGTTLTSPTVYISFQTVYAEDLCTPVGRNHTGSIIGMAPQDVSTIFGNLLDKSWSYRQINYDYLTMSQVPLSVYEEQPFCGGHCTTILPEYHPTLSMPPQIRSLDPAWANCDLALYGIYDPPSALHAAASIAVPTPVSGNPVQASASATQAGSVGHTTPAATAIPDNANIASSSKSVQQTGEANTSPTTGGFTAQSQTSKPASNPALASGSQSSVSRIASQSTEASNNSSASSGVSSIIVSVLVFITTLLGLA